MTDQPRPYTVAEAKQEAAAYAYEGSVRISETLYRYVTLMEELKTLTEELKSEKAKRKRDMKQWEKEINDHLARLEAYRKKIVALGGEP